MTAHREFSYADTYVNLRLRQQTREEECVKDYRSAFAYCRDLIKDSTQEHFIVIYLDIQLHPICWRDLNIGNARNCNIDTLTLVQTALLCNAEHIIVIHNHPSGSVTPSLADMEFTDMLFEKLQWFGISLLDSIIVGEWKNGEAFYSFYRDDKRPYSPLRQQREQDAKSRKREEKRDGQ